jgi:hypothetical protein
MLLGGSAESGGIGCEVGQDYIHNSRPQFRANIDERCPVLFLPDILHRRPLSPLPRAEPKLLQLRHYR